MDDLPKPTDITRLLRLVREGDKAAEADLIPLVYGQLRQIAAGLMKSERVDHTLQPTALVHEAYARMMGKSIDLTSRGHFFAIAGQTMRRVLVDYARGRIAQRRGGNTQVKLTIEENTAVPGLDPDQLLELDEALTRLANLNERQCRVVELRYFAGLTNEEIAEVLTVSARTIKRDWSIAKAWLYGELSNHADGPT
jgi:RNA polymerase sigma factor (TIGR02999 family)